MSWWKRLFKRLAKPGMMPEAIRKELEADGIKFFWESITVTVVFRNFRAPGRRHGYKTTWARGSLGISKRYIAGFVFSRPIVHIPFSEPAFKSLTFEAKMGKYLSISFDTSIFNPKHSGQMELRFHVPDPDLVANYLRAI